MYGLLALLPFVVGHILSVYIIGLDYSPIYIVNESLITLRDSNKELFKILRDVTGEHVEKACAGKLVKLLQNFSSGEDALTKERLIEEIAKVKAPKDI